MNAAPHSLSNPVSVSASHQKHGDDWMKYLSQTDGGNIASSRKAFANLLWAAFPAPSENDLAERAGAVLEVSPRQVKNWLRCHNSAAIHYFFKVAMIAGAEVVLRDRAGDQ